MTILERFRTWLDQAAADGDDLSVHERGLEPVEDQEADVACDWTCACQPGQQLT